MFLLSLDEVLKILFMYRVRLSSNQRNLIVTGGGNFPPHVRSSISVRKRDIIKVYSKEIELMSEIDLMEARAEEAERRGKDGEYISDLWFRYFSLSESLKLYLPKPWATVPEDEKRCSFCPNLGKPEVDGVLCDHQCKKPY